MVEVHDDIVRMFLHRMMTLVKDDQRELGNGFDPVLASKGVDQDLRREHEYVVTVGKMLTVYKDIMTKD